MSATSSRHPLLSAKVGEASQVIGGRHRAGHIWPVLRGRHVGGASRATCHGARLRQPAAVPPRSVRGHVGQRGAGRGTHTVPFAVEMYLDSAAEDRVRAVWHSLQAAGLDSTMIDVGARPHLSLVVLDQAETESLCTLVQEFAASAVGLSSEFAGVGTFPGEEGVVFLAPVVRRELLILHRDFHRRLEPLGMKSHEYYRPERWVPHCTVGMGLSGDSLAAAMGICRGSAAFGPFTIAQVGLIEFRPVATLCLHGGGRDESQGSSPTGRCS